MARPQARRGQAARPAQGPLAVGETTLEVRASEVGGVGDAPMLPAPLGPIPEGRPIASVTADGACVARGCRCAIASRSADADAVIPHRRNAGPRRKDSPGAVGGSEAPQAIESRGRTMRRRWSGHHRGSRAETRMSRRTPLGQRRQLATSTGGSFPDPIRDRRAPCRHRHPRPPHRPRHPRHTARRPNPVGKRENSASRTVAQHGPTSSKPSGVDASPTPPHEGECRGVRYAPYDWERRAPHQLAVRHRSRRSEGRHGAASRVRLEQRKLPPLVSSPSPPA
jgi:hypothetical protein